MMINNKNSDQIPYQYQTIINLYESDIQPEAIAFQVDAKIEDVFKIINDFKIKNEIKGRSLYEASKIPKLGMIFVDPVFDIDKAIEETQVRIWHNLKVSLKFDIPQDNTQELLEKFGDTNVVLVILCVDLVGSTDLSMNLPLKTLVPIIQTFTQEMSLIIQAYGGYVLKYVGDAILAFFFTKIDDLYLPCVNAINCGHSMLRIIKEGINPILSEYGYPELGIRIGIDIGENAIVRYDTWSRNKNEEYNNENYDTIKEIQHSQWDILGYTINTASKMLYYALPNNIILGQEVYNKLSDESKLQFRKINTDSSSWCYLNCTTGHTYEIYGLIKKNVTFS